MRLCRFDENRLGVVRGTSEAPVVHDVTAILEALPSFRYPLPDHDPLVAALPSLRPQIEALADGAPAMPLAGLRLLPPVASPRKIVAAPVNYRLHHDEALADQAIHHGTNILPIDKAGLFLKAPSSLIGSSRGLSPSAGTFGASGFAASSFACASAPSRPQASSIACRRVREVITGATRATRKPVVFARRGSLPR